MGKAHIAMTTDKAEASIREVMVNGERRSELVLAKSYTSSLEDLSDRALAYAQLIEIGGGEGREAKAMMLLLKGLAEDIYALADEMLYAK